MKSQLKNIALILIAVLGLVSCTDDNDATTTTSTTTDELKGLTKFQEMSNDTHIIEMYKHMGGLEQGYNEITLRIKDKATNSYVKNATVSWMPVMHMEMMEHSCPKSKVEKVTTDGTTYEGYIVFQMAQNATEYWDLKIDYTINGMNYSATAVVDVPTSDHQVVTSFKGSDNVRYIVAYIEPHHPKVAVNDLEVGVWKMQDMMNFPMVDGYTVKIDPRMPSMGNHGSPNNVDATQTSAGEMYFGKMSLTMTGYWRINLQLLNASNEVLKGEAISGEVTESSIYFEVEF
jgi:hypothetical protein